MTTRSKTTVALLATAALLIIWLIGNQTRLTKSHAELQDELAIIKQTTASKTNSRARARSRDSTPEKLSGLPNHSDLQGKLKRMEKQVAELQAQIAELSPDRETTRRPFEVPSEALTTSNFTQEKISTSDVVKIGARGWGHEQALGAPDTEQLGDIPSAWAPSDQNGGEEWLQVDFDKAVALSEINVHETFNPGAIRQVAAVMPDGSEKVIWEGEFESESPTGVIERAFQVEDSITAGSVKIYMDTTRVSGWNEIDAVELVGSDNSRQWASSVSASSSYARSFPQQ